MAKEEATATGGEFMLFGVRVVVDSMRKSVSLNNLSQYEHRLDSSSSNDVVPAPPPLSSVGYASADDAVVNHSSSTTAAGVSRERKRGVPWTEDEHKLFLVGLHKVGKGDWRGISRNFVKTRTPTQVASHAQKYFLRRSNLNRRRRRSSLFDITTDSVAVNNQEEANNDEQRMKNGGSESECAATPPQQPKSETSNVGYAVTTKREASILSSPTGPIYPLTNLNQTADQAVTLLPKLSMVEFDLNSNNDASSFLSLNLNLSLSMSASDLSNSRHSSAFQVAQGDSIISVA